MDLRDQRFGPAPNADDDVRLANVQPARVPRLRVIMRCLPSCSARTAITCAPRAGKTSPCVQVCRAPKGNNRNLALEKLAESTLFPCKYRSKGCTTFLLIADKKRHENSCERGPCCCVLDRKSCKWRGPLQRLLGHILGTHDFVPRLQDRHQPERRRPGVGHEHGRAPLQWRRPHHGRHPSLSGDNVL
ncbi:hypothetical protein MRX96_009390 [Rhipicephalus microplus]